MSGNEKPCMGVYIHGVEYVKAPEQPAVSVDWDVYSARRMASQISLHYAVVDFSSWDGSSSATIVDPRFHQLRKRYLEAFEELTAYVDGQLTKHDLEFS
jgi:hypothetical protein